jgi:hypothetical protein
MAAPSSYGDYEELQSVWFSNPAKRETLLSLQDIPERLEGVRPLPFIIDATLGGSRISDFVGYHPVADSSHSTFATRRCSGSRC